MPAWPFCSFSGYGCIHCRRKCRLVTPCCEKIYTCQFCHDDQEFHTVNRKAIKYVICMLCGKRQSVRSNCYICRTKFGKYYCLKCNLFDDEEKGQFHCDGCGICRIGGYENFYHCATCNVCISVSMRENHRTPCCGKIYTCRFCHDEQETHTMDRKAIKDVVCLVCEKRQRVRGNCSNCEVRFGKYYCLECNLFDDEEKGQFHCEGCGICRVGGGNNFYHCQICNMCLSTRMLGNHKCVENRSHTDCPVCMEDLHNSRNKLHIPACGHLLHETCFEKMEKAGHTVCPICKQAFTKRAHNFQ